MWVIASVDFSVEKSKGYGMQSIEGGLKEGPKYSCSVC
jgi:hypothetical protein